MTSKFFVDHSNFEVSSERCECPHSLQTDIDGVTYCDECGEELEFISHKQDWKNYSGVNNRSAKDNSRCRNSKSNESPVQSVFKECNIQIAPALVNMVQRNYDTILAHERSERKRDFGVDEKIVVRGKSRRALVAACRWKLYSEFDNKPTEKDYVATFGITAKMFDTGVDRYDQAFPDEPIVYTTSKDLLKQCMVAADIDPCYYPDIVKLNDKYSKSSKTFVRSRPKSVAASIVYLWLLRNPDYRESLGVTKASFSENTGISDITITRLVNEVNDNETIEVTC